jgi:acyl-CoA synthetase (AMP-forming)/AMP-acid ligase II
MTGKASLKIPGIDTSSFAPRREGVHGFVVIPRKGRSKMAKNSRPWSSGNLGSHISCFEELNERYGLPSEAHTIASPTGSSIGKNDLPMIVGPESEILPEDLCQILFTSGTTSTPKGVISTQRQCISCLSLAGYGGARALVARRAVLPPPPSPGLDEDQLCTLVLVPLFHTTGGFSIMMNGIEVAPHLSFSLSTFISPLSHPQDFNRL